MRRNLLAIVLVAAMGLLQATPTLAAPQITGISGSLNHGQIVTIQGSGFGTKIPAAPLRFDDFENGTLGDRLPTQSQGGWLTGGGNGDYPHYSQGRQRVPGEKVAEQDYLVSGIYNQTIGLEGIDFKVFYMSTWVYRDDFAGTALQSTNQKLWGNFGEYEPGSWYGNPQCRVDSYGGTSGGHLYATDDSGAVVENLWEIPPLGNYLDRWFRAERFIDQGTVGHADFRSWVAADLDKLAEITGTYLINEHRDDYFVFGHYFRTSDGGELKSYVSEMYCDTTLARIEVGDNANWDACSHREIQAPTTWTTSSAAFRANLGTFHTGDTAYVFLVDRDGNHNGSGYEVVIGEAVSNDFPPSIEIQQPTSSDTYQTDLQTILVGGAASDDGAISTVAWSTSGGDSGTATNVSGNWTQWEIPAVPLGSGVTVITVTVQDSGGQTGSDVLTVTASGDEGPPGPPTIPLWQP